MPLDINGYNATFRKFAEFAQSSMDAGQAKAVADAGVKPLAGRRILAVSTAQNDAVHKWTRTNDQYIVNDRTRTLFKKAVIDMFGGESKIPASVKKAMLLSDYDAGKPLTARRIMAVKNAIDADGTARARSEKIRLASFVDPANKAAMLAKGYSKAELPRLARAAHFYAEVHECAEFEALDEITKPGSKANRLMQYGGRFLESAANFREGLRLLDSFAAWFADTKATLDATGRNFQDGAGKTVLNGDSSYFRAEKLRGMEKFIFEELACNPVHDLAEQDPEKLFGIEHNAATRFFGRGLGNAFTQNVANIPPAKRAAFYAAMSAAFPLVNDPAIARLRHHQRVEQGFQTISPLDRGNVMGRVMKNLDKLQALLDKGQLTFPNFVKTCFPEARHKTFAGVNDLIQKWNLELRGDDVEGIEAKYPAKYMGPMQLMMEATGCTIEEAFTAAQGGKYPPIPKYVAPGTLSLEAFDGTVREARNQLEGDLNRPSGYNYSGDENQLLPADAGFRFNFPDGSAYKTNASREGRANIPTVADKAEALCGAVHREQASSVLMLLSQSGLGNLRGGLAGYGIVSNEHAAVDFTLSKDEKTGAVTIKYTSPMELPFHFEWTATVDVYGNVSSTPMKFMDARKFAPYKAGFDGAVAAMQDPSGTHSLAFANDIDRAKPLIAAFMRATGGDTDLISLLKDTYVCTKLLYDYKNDLRPIGDILPRVARLKENVAELREATKGNPAMFKLGLARLAGLGGKPAPTGLLTALVKAVNAADIGKLKKLSASADTPAKMNAAIVQYHKAVAQSIRKSNIMEMFGGEVGGEEVTSMKMFVGGLVTGRLGQSALRAIKGALEAPAAGQLQAIYDDLGGARFDEADVPGYEADVINNTAVDLSGDIASLLLNVDEALGGAKGSVPKFGGDIEELDGYADIAGEIREMIGVAHADLIEAGRLDAATAAVKSAASGVASRANDPRVGTVNALVAAAVRATGGDEALLGLLQNKKVIAGVLVSGGGIRTEEKVLEKVAALKANVDELRTATKGNQAMFEAGLRGLANLGGKAYNAGCIAAMVRGAASAKIGAISKLSAASGAGDIHKAVVQYHTTTTDIMKKSRALASFEVAYAEETVGTKSFIGMLLFARLSTAQLEAVDAAIHSVAATKTGSIYQLFIKERVGLDDFGIGAEIRGELPNTARTLDMTINDIGAGVSETLGREPVEVDYFEGEVDAEMLDIAAGTVLPDLETVARQQLADEAAGRPS